MFCVCFFQLVCIESLILSFLFPYLSCLLSFLEGICFYVFTLFFLLVSYLKFFFTFLSVFQLCCPGLYCIFTFGILKHIQCFFTPHHTSTKVKNKNAGVKNKWMARLWSHKMVGPWGTRSMRIRLKLGVETFWMPTCAAHNAS